MTKTLIVGNEEFEYPVTGTNPSELWGSEASDWAEAVTDVLSTLRAPSDISLTTFPLSDNITSPANIIGLKFSTTVVIEVEIDYIIQRIVGGNVIAENGKILGNYNGTDFSITRETCGDAGIEIDVTSTGQFTYTSSNLGHTSCIIKFMAKTIAN